MRLKQNFSCCTGTLDSKSEMVCVPDRKYFIVELCLKDKESGWNIPISKVKLHHGETVGDVKDVFDDAVKLGEEIARRYNECEVKK